MASMVRREAVSIEGTSQKVQAAAGELKSPAYVVEHHNGYRMYAVPGNKTLELIAEGDGLSSFVSGLRKLDANLRRAIESYAARLSEGKIAIIDAKDLTRHL